jgi:hypothetical protein
MALEHRWAKPGRESFRHRDVMAVIFFSYMQHALTLRIPLLCGLDVELDDVGSVLQHCSLQPGRRLVETEP